MINSLLTEKLRPKELKHMILPERIKNALMNLNNQQQSVNDVLKLFKSGVEISD